MCELGPGIECAVIHRRESAADVMAAPTAADVAQAACGVSVAVGLTRRVVCDLEAGHPGPHSGHDLVSTGQTLVSRWYCEPPIPGEERGNQ
jgi:hypothetical protein